MQPRSLLGFSLAILSALVASSSAFGRSKKIDAVPTMTIEIYNDSAQYSIYPVLSTGAHSIDTWMQAAFKIPQSQVANYPYPTPDTFRLYFNPTGTGIPPGGSIRITLPLYTQIVPVRPKYSCGALIELEQTAESLMTLDATRMSGWR